MSDEDIHKRICTAINNHAFEFHEWKLGGNNEFLWQVIDEITGGWLAKDILNYLYSKNIFVSDLGTTIHIFYCMSSMSNLGFNIIDDE